MEKKLAEGENFLFSKWKVQNVIFGIRESIKYKYIYKYFKSCRRNTIKLVDLMGPEFDQLFRLLISNCHFFFFENDSTFTRSRSKLLENFEKHFA